MEPKTTTLHPTCFKISAMHSVCCYNLLGWRSFWNVPPSLMDWPGWQFLFTFRPPKHKLGRGREDLPSGDAYSSRHLVPSLWDLHMFYLLRPILFRTCRYFTGLCSSNIPRYFLDFASCQVSAVSEEKSKYVSANQRPGRPYCFLDQPKKHKLGRGR